MAVAGDEERRTAARALWARGDYATVGDLVAGAGPSLCERVGVAGLEVLDVGTGTGSTALAAARAGGRVTGVDLTPELLAVARRRAHAAGLQVEWQEADALSLPCPDAAFDRVLSTFAVMFAPDPGRAAAELVRVCRPGGVIGVCSWTPDSVFGRLGTTLMGFLPDPPPKGPSPLDWGEPAAVRGFFDGLPVQLSFHHAAVGVSLASVEDAVGLFEERSGPVMAARDALGPAGRWPEARAAMAALFAEADVATEGSLRMEADYLVALAAVGPR